MRLALLSDVHANIEALRAVLADADGQGAARIVCLGDIIGYNTDPAACIDLLKAHDVICIAGNHDRAVCGLIGTETFTPRAARAVAWTRARLRPEDFAFLQQLPPTATVCERLIVVHGALHPLTGRELVRLDNEEKMRQSFAALAADPSGARLCAFGHTHRAGVYESCGDEIHTLRPEPQIVLNTERAYLINPGTVGEPRSSDCRASYMVLDLAANALELRHIAYDAAETRAKTRRAGLGPAAPFVPKPLRGPIAALAGRLGWTASLRDALRF